MSRGSFIDMRNLVQSAVQHPSQFTVNSPLMPNMACPGTVQT
jgi:hypothetical protein